MRAASDHDRHDLHGVVHDQAGDHGIRLIDKGKAFNERPSHSSFSREEVGFAEAAAQATYSWHGALSLPQLRGSYELVYKLNVSVYIFRTLRVCLQQRGIRTLQRSIDS